MTENTEVEKVYTDFWKDIIENSDGSINMEQLKSELYDYHFIIGNTAKVFCELTGSRISKPNTLADVVITVANDVMSENFKRDMAERLQYILDTSKTNGKISAIENLIDELNHTN